MDLFTVGLSLIGAGVGLIAFGQLLNKFIRGFVDYKLGKKEGAADEAAKNSAIALDKYRDSKRKYDDNK